MAGDEFLRWHRDMERVRRELETFQGMAQLTSSMRAMVDAGEQMRSVTNLGEERRRMVEAICLPPSSVAAALAEFPAYSRMLETSIRPDLSSLLGTEHLVLPKPLGQTVGAYLSAMSDVQRSEVLGRSLLPSLSLTEALSATYAAGVATHLTAITASADRFSSLRDAADRIGTFRTAIEVGAAQMSGFSALRGTLEGLDLITSGATAIWSGISDDIERYSSVPSPLREVPVLYAFEATRAVALLFSGDEEVVDARPPQSLVGARAASLPSKLERLHPKIAEKYHGVLHAIGTRGPDYVSQASASARELLKFTVEKLAPDDEVLAFNPRSDRDKHGKLTRRARLNFIFRRVAASEDYAKMVDGQIDLILASWFPLNTAVHALAPDLEHQQVESLVIQVEFGLIEMLHASDPGVEV